MAKTGLWLAVWGVALAGCAPLNPWQESPYVTLRDGVSSPVVCPTERVVQAQNVTRMLPRVELGMAKLEVISLLGAPANGETFALADGHAVEVFFYHTTETICRLGGTDGRLLPVVFQDGRVLGYGPSYYRDFLVPILRTPLTDVPEKAKFGTAAVPSAKAKVPVEAGPSLKAEGPAFGRMVQEDLPTPAAPAARRGAGAGREVGYDDTQDTQRNQLGAGEPLR